jgi:hypothetical protein
VVIYSLLVISALSASLLSIADQDPVPPRATDGAQHLFYNGQYDEAGALLRDACSTTPVVLSTCELHTSVLHFRLKRALGDDTDRGRAFKRCASCPAILAQFVSEVAKGQAAARAELKARPGDEAALFYLGKLDLNYVWLHLGTLGRKTGWGEYWEARKALDTVLKKNAQHVRARVARAWIDYIVDTRMPMGTRWLLGGGDKKRGLRTVREAVDANAEFYESIEAAFALWDMQVRERQVGEAVVTARRLARDFPENQELRKFLDAHEPRSQQ